MRMKRTIYLLFTIMFCRAHEKPIILWDLHGVLFHQHSFISTLLQYPNLPQIISHISWPFIKDLFQAGITNIEYLPIAQKYHNPYLQDFLIRAANNVSPIPAMQQLVFELADLGYEQQIASNINPIAFAQLTNPHIYPQYAPFFAVFNLRASQTAFVRNDTVIKKPNPAYYQEYLMKNNLNPFKRRIIFIDDLKPNITTARALGFDTILFKHSYQLRTVLRARGIDVAPPPYLFSHQRKSYSSSLYHQKKALLQNH